MSLRRIAALAVLAIPFVLAGCTHPQQGYYAPPPPPSEFSRAAQQGYNDGIRAAQNDIHRGLAPDVRRHPRFDNPPVPPPAFEEYRHGFRAGYDQVFRGGPGPR
ncbi:MAG: hypothetical protein ABSF23_04185 [Terracidiphilus sp.]|jgi:hypothetical protein